MQSIPATVTYLAMEARGTAQPRPRPMMKTAILKAENPPVHFYRYLYDAVGRDYFWIERRLWSDEKLAEMLGDERISLYVLYVAGVPAGMAELDFRKPAEGQIAYFGLMPEFTGRRIGPWLLSQAIELAWAQPVEKLLVNTCSLDHRKALATYQRAGFVPYARSEKLIEVPADFPMSQLPA